MKRTVPDTFSSPTSNQPGLVAAYEIFGQDSDQIVYLSDEEFKQWLVDSPDEKYCWHVHFWSYFSDALAPDIVKAARKAHPIPSSCAYWQHVEGTMWDRLAGRGGNHLWKWDGSEPTLLEEALTNWVS